MTLMRGNISQWEARGLTPEEQNLRECLMRDVETLAGDIGERNLLHYSKFLETVEFVEDAFLAAGCDTQRQEYDVGGARCFNVVAEVPGSSAPGEIVVVGAHYDTVLGCPGASDNASAVAAVLAFARSFAGRPAARTLRFVSFANEEMPYYGSPAMGSMVYARRCRELNKNVVGMMALEMVGTRAQDDFLESLFPDATRDRWPCVGNFVAFAGDERSRPLVAATLDGFQRHNCLPSIAGLFPEDAPGVSWSDHMPFWREGYQALIVIDTAAFRYPYYHKPEDTAEKLDYDRMALFAAGLERVLRDLA